MGTESSTVLDPHTQVAKISVKFMGDILLLSRVLILPKFHTSGSEDWVCTLILPVNHAIMDIRSAHRVPNLPFRLV